MPEEPKRPKNLIAFIIFITVVLICAGGAIYYYISQVVNFSPDVDNEATVPCRCQWVSEDDNNRVYAEATGHLQGSDCVFPQSYEIGSTDIEQCSDITELDEIEILVATQTTGTLGPGVIALSSNPILPPLILSDDNQTVTFTVDFSLYNLDSNIEYEQAEMIISYPDTDASPESLLATLTDDNTSTYTYIENGQTVTGYRVTFLSTWNEVTNYGEEGLYKVSFRAKDTNEIWTDPSTGTLQYAIGNVSEGGYYCNNIDLVQTRTSGSANVTMDVLANLPEGYEPTYTWNMDVDCSGDVDDDEIFTGTSDTITKEFTYPSGETAEVECPASVTIELNDGTDIEDRSQDSCLGYVTLNPLSEMCGDGILDETEECDPEIDETSTDYNVNCQNDCTILVEDTTTDTTDDDTDDTGTDTDTPITADIDITQICPSCISLSDGSPTAEISITVSNDGDISKTVRAVSNTLPQGFVFSEGSSTVNEIANTLDTGVTVETAEESQLITWDNEENGWTITAGGSLEIVFNATVGDTVAVGTYSNTVTVTPSDTDPIQSIKGIIIAQDCEQPETALFDRTIFPILIGTAFLLFSTLAYYTGFGTKRFGKMMDQVSDMGLLITQPQKYRENRIEETVLKEIKKRSKDQN